MRKHKGAGYAARPAEEPGSELEARGIYRQAVRWQLQALQCEVYAVNAREIRIGVVRIGVDAAREEMDRAIAENEIAAVRVLAVVGQALLAARGKYRARGGLGVESSAHAAFETRRSV